MRKNKLTLYDCDRCMFTYKKHTLRKQRGMYLCESCFDTTLEIEPLNMKFNSPRSDSTTITAVNNPTVFTVTTAGITALNNSHINRRGNYNKSFVMHVVGSPTTITANPQIVAGSVNNLLTIIGTSDSNYVTIKAGNGTDIATDMVLRNGSIITLVYNTTSSLWCETSRSVGGIYG